MRLLIMCVVSRTFTQQEVNSRSEVLGHNYIHIVLHIRLSRREMIGFTEYIILAISVLLLILVLQYGFSGSPYKLPPGPRGYPIVGNIGQINFKDFINEFRRLRRLYGDVFMLRFFNRRVIVINGTEALKDLLVKEADALSDRPKALGETNPQNLGLYIVYSFELRISSVVIILYSR